MSNPRNLPDRVVIYPKDIKLVTGLCIRSCRDKMYEIKKAGKKAKHTMITVEEFCNYFGIPQDIVRPLLK